MRRSALVTLARHLAAVTALPFVVTIVIPYWISRQDGSSIAVGHNALLVALQILGAATLTVGIALFGVCLGRFATDGDGTLAPWDPPKRLVISGPYKFVRNPMITGVVTILLAEAMLRVSIDQLLWALAFLVANIIQFVAVEEPGLRRRFGDAYVEYCRHVPRLIPRLTPWIPDGN